MDTAQIKAYAPQARKDFISAVTQRAARFGIHGDDNFDPVEFKGDTAIIGSQVFTKKGGELREKLVAKVKQIGFQMFIRSSAYTWFNRFVAIRYMELHGFLDHGFRVLSNPNGSDIPEVLEYATEVDLPGLDKEKVLELRLAGDKDNELYRMLVIAQCNALHNAMPFLFDKIDNEAELLLPDNLLHTNSPVKKMVSEINENLWKDVEIIGWIYQFYISEKKDEVIGKVVKSEDIPAATQLFTPNWIVKYMVQNTLGRMWMATYPESSLKSKMEYYIEPAEQEPEVQVEIDAATPKELNPEELTFLDPACGSGHILVEAYDILKKIYLERGYRTRDIPRLILSKNIYGLDIDDRAAQLACFAVLMKARKDDRRLFGRDNLKLNVMSIVETKGIDKAKLLDAVSKRDGGKSAWIWIVQLLELFENAKNFGALITIPNELAEELDEIYAVVEQEQIELGDIFSYIAGSELKFLRPILGVAHVLSKNYKVVVTNPPYMGSKWMNKDLKLFLKNHYQISKADLMTCFMERAIDLNCNHGYWGMINLPSWMFLGSFEKLRNRLAERVSFSNLLHLGRGIFGSDFGTVAFTIHNHEPNINVVGIYRRLFKEHVQVRSNEKIRNLFLEKSIGYFEFQQNKFKEIPGTPIAYWLVEQVNKAFKELQPLSACGHACSGLQTGNNELYLRQWYEVKFNKIGYEFEELITAENSTYRWFPHKKGGAFRRWYGNCDYIIDWHDSGHSIKNNPSARPQNIDYWFRESVTWSHTSSGSFSARYSPIGYTFNVEGPSFFSEDSLTALGYLCSTPALYFMQILNPTLHFLVGSVSQLPFPELNSNKTQEIHEIVKSLVEIAQKDWDLYEISWDFKKSPLIEFTGNDTQLKSIYSKLYENWIEITSDMKKLEEKNNKIFIDSFSLSQELSPEVSMNEITLICNPKYRFGDGKTEKEYRTLQCIETIKELISYAIGCMMGRYSLDNPGLIFANSDGHNFDSLKYQIFPADNDGIIPIMDMDWFQDDATKRFVEFIKIAWPKEHLDENLKFVADSLNPKNNESPEDTIRRYLSLAFFKDHMKMYKKRPIYWLFSSGKQKAFECLVYLHRYNESTLSRMRSSYVTPLQGNINARIEFLEHERDAATTASAQKKIQKQIDVLKKKQVELKTFDDELRHYADMRISLDLDDGVKVNYGKFGNLLAEKKAIAGKS